MATPGPKVNHPRGWPVVTNGWSLVEYKINFDQHGGLILDATEETYFAPVSTGIQPGLIPAAANCAWVTEWSHEKYSHDGPHRRRYRIAFKYNVACSFVDGQPVFQYPAAKTKPATSPLIPPLDPKMLAGMYDAFEKVKVDKAVYGAMAGAKIHIPHITGIAPDKTPPTHWVKSYLDVYDPDANIKLDFVLEKEPNQTKLSIFYHLVHKPTGLSVWKEVDKHVATASYVAGDIDSLVIRELTRLLKARLYIHTRGYNTEANPCTNELGWRITSKFAHELHKWRAALYKSLSPAQQSCLIYKPGINSQQTMYFHGEEHIDLVFKPAAKDGGVINVFMHSAKTAPGFAAGVHVKLGVVKNGVFISSSSSGSIPSAAEETQVNVGLSTVKVEHAPAVINMDLSKAEKIAKEAGLVPFAELEAKMLAVADTKAKLEGEFPFSPDFKFDSAAAALSYVGELVDFTFDGFHKFELPDVTEKLHAAAEAWLKEYSGDFEFLLSVQASQISKNFITPAQAKGVLNCMRAEWLKSKKILALAEAYGATTETLKKLAPVFKEVGKSVDMLKDSLPPVVLEMPANEPLVTQVLETKVTLEVEPKSLCTQCSNLLDVPAAVFDGRCTKCMGF